MKNNCIVKKAFFSKSVIRESSVIEYGHECSLDLSLLKNIAGILTKYIWPP